MSLRTKYRILWMIGAIGAGIIDWVGIRAVLSGGEAAKYGYTAFLFSTAVICVFVWMRLARGRRRMHR